MIDPAKIVDVSFPVRSTGLPADHGYLLFSALCEALPRLSHEPGWAIHLVDGGREGNEIRLHHESSVGIRLLASELGEALALTGRELAIGLHRVRLGAATVSPLRAAPRLRAVVTIPGRTGRAAFTSAVRREIAGFLPLRRDPRRISVEVGEKRVLRARVRTVIGYEVELAGLRPDESLAIQAHGIGARRHMGAGVFTPRPSPPPAPRSAPSEAVG